MTIGDALSLKISVEGDTQAVKSFDSIGDSITRAASKGGLLRSLGLNVLSVAGQVKLLKDSWVAAGNDQALQLQIQGVTGSAALAAKQIAIVRAESEKGILGAGKDDLGEAVLLFDKAHESITRLLPLAEQLGVRTGQGVLAAARAISGLAGGGVGRLQGLLRSGGFTPQQLRGAGLDVNSRYRIGSSPERVLSSLERLLSRDQSTSLLGGGIDASGARLSASFTDLERSIGQGLIPILQPLENGLGTVVQFVTRVNDRLSGWPGILLLAYVGIRTLVGGFRLLRRGAASPVGNLGLLRDAAYEAAEALEDLARRVNRLQFRPGGGGSGSGGGSGVVPVGSGNGPGVRALPGGSGMRALPGRGGGSGTGIGPGAGPAAGVGLIGGTVAGTVGIVALTATAFIAGGVAIAAGIVGSLPGFKRPSQIVKEHLEDLERGDPDWMLQRNDRRRRHAQPSPLPPAVRNQRRATADAVMLGMLGSALPR
jgi:hypothetical protein